MPDHTLLLTPSLPLTLQHIRAGSFRMGSRGNSASEEPVHLVAISEDFYLGTFPVTQAQFAVWTQAAGIKHENHFKDRPDHPAENTDWDEASAFCQWINDTPALSQQLPAGYHAALPSEAQWEYACRAGTETEYWSGDGEAALAEVGWFGEDWEKGSTHPVGQKPANPWGLHDMHGNVWEWCRDAWDEVAYAKRSAAVVDPFVDGAADSLRVVRGGSFNYAAGWCRSADRDRRHPGNRIRAQGFRLCLSSGPVGQTSRGAETSQASGAGTGVGGGGTTTETEGPSAADWTHGSTLPKIPTA